MEGATHRRAQASSGVGHLDTTDDSGQLRLLYLLAVQYPNSVGSPTSVESGG